METVRMSARVTGTLIGIAIASILIHYWYSLSGFDYFDMVKAFMYTKMEINRIHIFFINLAFWMSVVISVVMAVLNYKYGFNIASEALAPLLIMCGMAFLFIPNIGFTNVHMFWFICYILVLVGIWFSAKKTARFCVKNSNLSVLLKEPGTKPELMVNRIDFIVVMLLTMMSYVLVVLALIGAIVFGAGNWKSITGSDDIKPAVSSMRYDTAVGFMNEGKYEKAIIKFAKLENYSDSKAMEDKCEDLLYQSDYLGAVELMDEGKYDDARSIFGDIYSYRDSEAKIEECDNLQYDEAVSLMEKGYYDGAPAIFETLQKIFLRK